MRLPVLVPPFLLPLVLLAGAPPPLRAQGLVDTARRYVTRPEGHFEYVADLDGDGDDDAIRFEDDPGPDDDVVGFRAWFNDGRGELGQPGPLVSFPDTGFFRSLNAVGLRRLSDLTGDGLVDVVVESRSYVPATSTFDSTLQIYRALSAGVFAPPISIPQNSYLLGATLGNADADPTRELAVVESVWVSVHGRREVVAWYDWNGSGFTRSAESTAAGTVDSSPTLLAALDVEGDGDSDLVYGGSDGQALRLALTSGGAPGPLTLVSLPLAQPARLVPIVCDLAGGGGQDLLVACGHGNASFELVPVLDQAGLLVPDAAQAFAADWGEVYPSSFRVGDWDGDGDGDVLYYGWQEPSSTTEGIVAFFANDGANDFGAGPVALARTNDPPGGSRWPGNPVDACDLDRDGRLDFLLPRSVQFGRGRFESALIWSTDDVFGPHPIALFDHDGDGDLDYFLDDPIFGSGQSVALNDGTGSFPGRVYPPPPPAGRERAGTGGIGDFDGDGRTDFLAGIQIPPPTIFDLAVFEEMRLYASDGLGGFRDSGPATSDNLLSPDRETNLTGDLDEDGDVDVLGRAAGGGGTWPNRGHGRFAAFVPLFPGCCTVPSALGDLDADGHVDVVTSSFSPTAVVAWRNRATGRARSLSERTPSFEPAPVFAAGPSSDSVTLADQDADGDLDLAFAWPPGIRLFVNDGNGGFSPGASLPVNLVPGLEAVFEVLCFQDLDDDGNVDLLAGAVPGSASASAVAVLRGTGGGAFEAARPHAGAWMGPAGDLDGDGDLDLSGTSLVRALRFDGPRDGRIRQYGSGTPGSGGAVPVLGASGPLRVGASGAAIRLRQARGGSPFALFFSLSAGSGPVVPFPGAPTLLDPPIHADLHATLGAPGEAGAGRFDLELGPELAALAGLTVFFQAGVTDPSAADGFALTNGLALTFGF